MNEVEYLAENLKPHVLNHESKECECWVKVGDSMFRLTGGISTWGNKVVFMATEDGKNTFAKP